MSFQYIPIHPRRMGKEKDEWDDLSCVFSMPQQLADAVKRCSTFWTAHLLKWPTFTIARGPIL
jgi:hypothetical protein